MMETLNQVMVVHQLAQLKMGGLVLATTHQNALSTPTKIYVVMASEPTINNAMMVTLDQVMDVLHLVLLKMGGLVLETDLPFAHLILNKVSVVMESERAINNVMMGIPDRVMDAQPPALLKMGGHVLETDLPFALSILIKICVEMVSKLQTNNATMVTQDQEMVVLHLAQSKVDGLVLAICHQFVA